MTGNSEVKYYGITDPGLKRTINQDSFSMHSHGRIGLFVVADGMGGHSHGEVASGKMIEAVDSFWEELENKDFQMSFPDLTDRFTAVIEEANRRIFEEDNKENVCGTTVVGLLIYEEYYAFFSVGDSRIYQRKGSKLKQLTYDDIWDNQPEVREKYSEKEIKEHQNRGKLLHAVGVQQEVNVHTGTGMLSGKQNYIVCSDGLYKYCDDKHIKRSFFMDFGKNNFKKIGSSLMENVKKNGAKDNVTFILVATEV